MNKNDFKYFEVFEKTTSNPEYVYKAVCDTYPSDLGWEVGTPKVVDLGNGEYKISIPLGKDRILENEFDNNSRGR